MRNWIGGILALVVLSVAPALGWEHWGSDRGGSRFAPLDQITSDNVGRLIEAWRS
jgi:quinoprotein glucose dehydrogenase